MQTVASICGGARQADGEGGQPLERARDSFGACSKALRQDSLQQQERRQIGVPMAEGGVGGRRQVDERAEIYSTGAQAQSARLWGGGGRWKSDSCRRYELLVQQNISDLNEALNAPHVTRRAGRVLRHDMLRMAGRKAHQQLAEEAERGDGQLDRVQRFLGCLRTLGSSGQKSGQILLPDGTQAVLVDSSVLRAAEDAAREMQQATRDAVAVAVLQAEARVNASWEAAWREQKQQLRHERSCLLFAQTSQPTSRTLSNSITKPIRKRKRRVCIVVRALGAPNQVVFFSGGRELKRDTRVRELRSTHAPTKPLGVN